MVDGGSRRPVLHENWAETDPPLQNVDFQSIFLLVAP